MASARAVLALLSCALVSCAAPGPRTAAPRAEATSAASTSATATGAEDAPIPAGASTSAPTSAAPPAPDRVVIPEAPPSVDRDKLAIVSAICSVGIFENQVGCRTHPPFVRAEQLPDGRAQTVFADPLFFCSLDQVYRGSFSRPGAEQALLAFGQCKDRDEFWDAAFPGSAVLVEKIKGRWTVVETDSARNLDRCKTLRNADGHDTLVCVDSFGAFSSGGLRWVFSYDFTRGPNDLATTHTKLFFDDFSMACGDNYFGGEWLEYGVTDARIGDLELVDTDGDGLLDVRFVVTRARVAPSPSLESRLRARCEATKDKRLDPPAYLPKPTKTTIELRGTGKTFVPTPKSERALQKWQNEAPASGWNMRG